jgi:hypothetical protein
MGTGGFFPRVKWLEHESAQSSPATVEVKKIWIVLKGKVIPVTGHGGP